MMFGLYESMREFRFLITTRTGDVRVLAARGWWRRLFRCESWAVAYRTREDSFKVVTPAGEKVKRYGHMRPVTDPDLWPDDVCAAVARLKFTL